MLTGIALALALSLQLALLQQFPTLLQTLSTWGGFQICHCQAPHRPQIYDSELLSVTLSARAGGGEGRYRPCTISSVALTWRGVHSLHSSSGSPLMSCLMFWVSQGPNECVLDLTGAEVSFYPKAT
jgi:hypothetical protein